MHNEIGVICVFKGHMFYSVVITRPSNAPILNSGDLGMDSGVSGRCSHAIHVYTVYW